MTLNALRDCAFLKTIDGRTTVRDALANAHLPNMHLDLTEPGYVVTSQLRLLTAVAAVALRHSEQSASDVARFGLPPGAIDQAIGELAPACDPFDKDFPFLQRPALPPAGPKDNSRKLGPNVQPVKKLSPAMPPDEAEEYWNLLYEPDEELELADALLNLAVFHNLSMAGNNAYDGDKCQMGSPAMRYVGADYTATEVIFDGPRLLDTLLAQIPRSWVEGGGLPAWADRTCNVSFNEKLGRARPLWSATWSSNAAACHWHGQTLTGVRTGGIPESWYLKSEMGTTKKSRKAWWDDRNARDPFYLYMPNDTGELKVQRVDFGVDGTALAVDWAAENKMEALLGSLKDGIIARPATGHRVLFARHQISGTASSPNIRASEIFAPDVEAWAFDIDDEVRVDIQRQALRLQRLNSTLRNAFRRKTTTERSTAPILDDLAGRQEDASNAFWRHITAVYMDTLTDLRDFYTGTRPPEKEDDGYELPPSLKKRALDATLAAFDETVAPHSLQEPAHIAFVRGHLERRLLRTLSQDELAQENK